MNHKADLRILQEQKLMLSPKLQLWISLLQLPLLELEQLIAQEIQTNPAIEIDEEEPTSPEEIPKSDILSEYFPQTYFDKEDIPSETKEGKRDKTQAEEFLYLKIAKNFKGKEFKIAKAIIQNLNPAGLLELSTEEIAKLTKTTQNEVENVLNKLKRINPVGIGANSFSEVLMLKLESKGFGKDSLENTIVSKYFPYFLQGKISSIARELKLERNKIQKAIKNILSLNPYPFQSIHLENESFPIIPDISIKNVNNRPEIILNRANIPNLKLSTKIKKILENSENYPKEIVQFAYQRYKRAKLFLQGVEERNNTLRKLGEIILANYRNFIEGKEGFSQPLDIDKIASELSLNKSTLYRAIMRKYIETPAGIFSMSLFFKKKGRKETENLIKEVIENEDPKNPYTDEEIAQKLKEMGVKLSRRMVTQYREKLGILDKNQRKFFKDMR